MEKPVITPASGERLLRFVGDTVRFTLHPGAPAAFSGARAQLRTNLGKAATLRREIIATHSGRRPLSVAFWRDIPMLPQSDGSWALELPVTEPGYFKAKPYLVDSLGRQIWPDGADIGLCCHPNSYRTGNTIYCAFTRLFGLSKNVKSTLDATLEKQMKQLDERGFTVIPPSGKLRDLTRELPHIMDTLGCKILHLLPVNPTPTTMAKFGRFGSPYACQDLTAIDPALVEFDKKTNGEDQFRELAYAVHQRRGRVFLDVVINHTGWGSTLFEKHPEWFLKNEKGTFFSPGAWGNTWEDLVELDPNFTGLWEHLAEAFLIWCRRGVDGFRCDAGYKVPLPVWQYIEARVRQEFPDTVFLLEGLGGSWEATETLLTDGGMQWAYSELFQNYSGGEVQWYLDYALRQSERVGVYVHYSETHDNDRLAKKGKPWSLLRNRLCALTSACGGFGFTCGVEWLADEKIEVHQSRGLNWGATENILPELAKLNELLTNHPCFFDGAKLTRLSPDASPVFALQRVSAEGKDTLLVLVNTDVASQHDFTFSESIFQELGEPLIDLLGQTVCPPQHSEGKVTFQLPSGAAFCLSSTPQPQGLNGREYRLAKAQSAWAISALSKVLLPEEIGGVDGLALAKMVNDDPGKFLGAVSNLKCAADIPSAGTKEKNSANKMLTALAKAASHFPQVVSWTLLDHRRITPIPPNHWLLIQDNAPFRATLKIEGEERQHHVKSIQAKEGHVAFFPPLKNVKCSLVAELCLERYVKVAEESAADLQLAGAKGHSSLTVDGFPTSPAGCKSAALSGRIHFLSAVPQFSSSLANREIADDSLVLLTNGIGGMARIGVDLGRIQSKYDCALGANLHATLPVDRHIFAKRIRVWANADGFITPLHLQNLDAFEVGPPAVWKFHANSGDERTVEIHLTADMLEGRNTTVFRFELGAAQPSTLNPQPLTNNVRLTVRVDIEDRSFHFETKRNGGAEHHFSANCHPLADKAGFTFSPSHDRQLRVFSDGGFYHHQAEWCENIPHPVEQTRGQVGSGDAYSPGWFDLPLRENEKLSLVLTADQSDPSREAVENFVAQRENEKQAALKSAADLPSAEGKRETPACVPPQNRNAAPPLPTASRQHFLDSFGQQLTLAARQFVVRRGSGKTVIAGYPWFLDWGRDTMIAARGLLAAGLVSDVTEILLTFGRFVENGTMPNTIHGDNASNRDTTDAPLWYGVVCAEAAEATSARIYRLPVDGSGKIIADVLREIAVGYWRGTPNGIRVDEKSGLVWSPSHFTWMDTNYPAGTPREGYPVEIQVLWIRLLRQLERIGVKPEKESWATLANRAVRSLHHFYWLEERGYFADLLMAQPGQSAAAAVADTALRSNYLLAVAFGLVTGEKAKRSVNAALQFLVVPGALRSLAPLPVSPPLRIETQGRLINRPDEPYWGRYAGDEDTQRKPAYHNGTAWTWTFPIFCEALAQAWEFSPAAVSAAKAYLGSMSENMKSHCLGQISEILDGDAPHHPRGCDAQAWGVTEALRVWKKLNPASA